MPQRVIACGFHPFPGHFQKDPLLRVSQLCFARTHAEEARVKLLNSLQHGAGSYIIRTAQYFFRNPGGNEFLITEVTHRFDAVAQVTPEAREIRRSREPARHADYGNLSTMLRK